LRASKLLGASRAIFILGPVYLLEVVFFWKMNSGKVNYFLMFGSVMENKLENTFQYLVMP
jgi:hypothetical protein